MYTIQYSQTASWLVAILATVNLPGLMARCSSGRGPQGVETWKIRPESFHHDAVLVVSSDCLGFWKTRCFLQFGNRNLFVCPSVHLCEGCTESSPFCSTLNTSYITGLDMCEGCTESSPFRSNFEHELHHRFGHVNEVRTESSPFRSTLNTSCITGLDMCEVCTESSPFRSTLNTSYITGLDMCELCTEVSIRTGTSSHASKQSMAQHVCTTESGGWAQKGTKHQKLISTYLHLPIYLRYLVIQIDLLSLWKQCRCCSKPIQYHSMPNLKGGTVWRGDAWTTPKLLDLKDQISTNHIHHTPIGNVGSSPRMGKIHHDHGEVHDIVISLVIDSSSSYSNFKMVHWGANTCLHCQ